MKSVVLLCLAAFAAAAVAQQPATTSTPPELNKSLDLERTVSRCPISMDARQEGGLHLVRTRDGSQAPQQPAITPSLTLTAPQGRQILSATITAHGYAAPKSAMPLEVQGGVQGRTFGVAGMQGLGSSQSTKPSKAPNQPIVLPQPAPAARPELTRTVTIKFAPNGDSSFSGKFRLPGFTVLESVDLNAVTFGDGSTWSFTSASGCHVTPDPFMLVNAGVVSAGTR